MRMSQAVRESQSRTHPQQLKAVPLRCGVRQGFKQETMSETEAARYVEWAAHSNSLLVAHVDCEQLLVWRPAPWPVLVVGAHQHLCACDFNTRETIWFEASDDIQQRCREGRASQIVQQVRRRADSPARLCSASFASEKTASAARIRSRSACAPSSTVRD